MNKSTIATFILATASAIALAYFMGFFDNTASSVSVSVGQNNGQQQGGGPLQTRDRVRGGVTATPTATPTQTTENVTLTTPPVETPVTTTKKALTKAEVAKHSTKSDCWMIVSNNVYNFTQYIVMHPGGQGAIVRECGMDGTRTFLGERKHLQPNVEAELATYLLGALE